MASGGSSGRPPSGSRSFDFGTDEVLCSYDDYASQEPSNGKRSDPSGKDFHENRMGRPLVNVYGQQEEYPKEDVTSAVEKCMKKYADNLLRSLEGISGRLSQLELFCYKLERSLSEFRSDMVQDQNEKDLKLKSLEKHLQEVHRSVQILRDKQELDETQKELAKLQLAQKESSTLNRPQKKEESVMPSASEPKRHDETLDSARQQLALVPHQTGPPPQLPARTLEQQQAPQDGYIANQAATFYLQRQPLPQDQQSQPVQPELQYVQSRSQVQDQAPPPPPQQPQIVNQNSAQPFPQYQQQQQQQPQWPQPPPQRFSQQVVQPQQPPSQSQMGPSLPPPYPTYPPHQLTNPNPEAFPGNMPLQAPYSSFAQPGGNRNEGVPLALGYGGQGDAISQAAPAHHSTQRQLQPQGSQSSFGPPLNKGGYAASAPYPQQSNVQGYNTMYAPTQNFQPGSYPPSNAPVLQSQQLPPGNAVGLHHTGSHMMRGHPYGEMIEKVISMGYQRDQVVNMIHRMSETGQPVDFNVLLDRLNSRPSGASPRGWSP